MNPPLMIAQMITWSHTVKYIVGFFVHATVFLQSLLHIVFSPSSFHSYKFVACCILTVFLQFLQVCCIRYVTYRIPWFHKMSSLNFRKFVALCIVAVFLEFTHLPWISARLLHFVLSQSSLDSQNVFLEFAQVYCTSYCHLFDYMCNISYCVIILLNDPSNNTDIFVMNFVFPLTSLYLLFKMLYLRMILCLPMISLFSIHDLFCASIIHCTIIFRPLCHE